VQWSLTSLSVAAGASVSPAVAPELDFPAVNNDIKLSVNIKLTPCLQQLIVRHTVHWLLSEEQ